jgi:hypothetical protein
LRPDFDSTLGVRQLIHRGVERRLAMGDGGARGSQTHEKIGCGFGIGQQWRLGDLLQSIAPGGGAIADGNLSAERGDSQRKRG